jgi:hypothetical protein
MLSGKKWHIMSEKWEEVGNNINTNVPEKHPLLAYVGKGIC